MSDPSSFPKSQVAPNIGNESLEPVEAGQQAGTTPHSSRHAPTHSDPAPSAADSSIPKDYASVAEVVGERPRGEYQDGGKVGFMEKAKGFAQVFNGKVHGDESKVLAGEAELRGVEGARKADV